MVERARGPWTAASAFLLLALLFAIGGIAAGASSYFPVLGVGLAATGFLLARARREAPWLYALVLLGATAWAHREVGFAGGPLALRLLAPSALALWLGLPAVRRRLGPGGVVKPVSAAPPLAAAAVAILVVVIGLCQPGATGGHSAAARAL